MIEMQAYIVMPTVLLVLYILARTIVLAVYRLAKKKQWVRTALLWATLALCLIAIFGPRTSALIVFLRDILGGIGSLFLIAVIVGFIPWRKSHEDLAHEDSKSYDEAMGIHRIQSVNPMHDDWSYW